MREGIKQLGGFANNDAHGTLFSLPLIRPR